MKKKISNWMLIKFLTVSWSFLWKYLSSLINLFSSKSRQWTFACPAGRSLFFFFFSLSSTAVLIGKNENEIRRNNVNRILEEGRKKKVAKWNRQVTRANRKHLLYEWSNSINELLIYSNRRHKMAKSTKIKILTSILY